MSGQIAIVQICCEKLKRQNLLAEKTLPKCLESVSKYVLVCPPVEEGGKLGLTIKELDVPHLWFHGWDKDMSAKWREGLDNLVNNTRCQWLALLADDVYPDEDWASEMEAYLTDKSPGQYGFRLSEKNGQRHHQGHDWMAMIDTPYGRKVKKLNYNIETGECEESGTPYVANCVIHRDVYKSIPPFGIFGRSPDVQWSLAIREAGFPVKFNPKARAYHVGNPLDNRTLGGLPEFSTK